MIHGPHAQIAPIITAAAAAAADMSFCEPGIASTMEDTEHTEQPTFPAYSMTV